MSLYLEITQNPVYAGLTGLFIYVIGIISVLVFIGCRTRCRRRKQVKYENKISKRAKEEAYLAEIRAERNSIIGSNIMSPRKNYQDNSSLYEIPKPIQRNLSIRSHTSLPQYEHSYFNTEPIYRQFRDCESPRRDGQTPRRFKNPRRLTLETQPE